MFTRGRVKTSSSFHLKEKFLPKSLRISKELFKAESIGFLRIIRVTLRYPILKENAWMKSLGTLLFLYKN